MQLFIFSTLRIVLNVQWGARTILLTIRWWNRIALIAKRYIISELSKLMRIITILTKRSSAPAGPSKPVGLISGLWWSGGALSNPCGPCGKPIVAPKAPNGFSAPIGCGGPPGTCCACICCWKSNISYSLVHGLQLYFKCISFSVIWLISGHNKSYFWCLSACVCADNTNNIDKQGRRIIIK